MIVKSCKKHGGLTQEQIYVCGNRRECRACVYQKTKTYRDKHKEKYREYEKNDTKDLKKNYIKKLLTIKTPLNFADISDDMVDIKRMVVQINRLKRQSK